MAKKISDATIDRLKSMTPADLASHRIIATAPNFNSKTQRGYICPMCNSGGHGNDNSDGAGCFDKNGRFYCYACQNADVGGHKLSPIDLYAVVRNMQHESFGAIVRAMAAEFGIDVEEESFGVPRRRRKNQTPPPSPKTSPEELELIHADLSVSGDALIQFVESYGGTWRGFTADFLIRHGCKFVADWTSTTSRLNKRFSTPTPRILIPSSKDFYLARFCGDLDRYDGATREFVEKNKKLNAGSPKLFLSTPNALDSDEPIFAVEGALDAMSIELAGFGAVALNAGGNRHLIVDALKRRQAEKKKLPLMIVMMDSDEKGRDEFAPKLYDALTDVGCPCCVRFLFDETTKTDANDILIRDGVDNLRERLQTIADSSRSELDACAQVLAEKGESLSDEQIDALFKGYDASDTAFARRLEKFFGNEIRWCDDEFWLTWTTGNVWQRRSEKNSVLAPYCQKLADLLNEYKSTKNEAYVAEKFQSARKHAAAVACLKGFESVRITAEDLDRHPFLFVVKNGVIDLTNGKLMAADPSLLLTQQAAAVYNPKCTDTTFADFLKSVIPEEDTREAVTSFFGYGLTADVSAEKFLLIYGTGGNGKGVMLLTLRTLLKDYAVELPVDTILEDTFRVTSVGRATPEISILANKRVGIVDELPRGGRLDIAKVNRLTGGDMVPFRKLYGNFDEIAPTHKLIMTGNYRPLIDDARDAALLRRLIAVKFEQDFTKNPDTTLKKKLLADSSLSGALNVLVPAAVNFCRDGLLAPSAKMKAARDEYLGENDFIGAYLAEFYEFGANLSVKRKELLKHLRANCKDAERYRDSDLVAMITKVDGVTYRKGDGNVGIFHGIGKAGAPKQDKLDFNGGEFLSSEDYLPPN